jgi:hypothetical protein
MSWLTLIVLGRILAEPNSPPPDVDDEAVLLIKRQDVTIGCTPQDASVLGDAAYDAAPSADAGAADAGASDAGTPDGGTCESIPGDAVTMIVQPHVTTSLDGTRFAVVLVTPQQPIVELAGDVFTGLAQATAPVQEIHTVEVPDSSLGTRCASYYSGGGCGGGYDYGGGGATWDPPAVTDARLGDGAVVSETIGPYQFVRAQPTSTSELARWLDLLGYAYMQTDLDAVAPYVALGYHVVAIRVAVAKPLVAPMIPIALTWAGSELRVPAALGHGAVAPGPLTVYVAADGRYEFANGRVRFAGRTSAMTGTETYVTRSEIMLDQNQAPAFDPIAFRVLDGNLREIETVTQEVHVPVRVDCSRDDSGGCCSDCSARPRTRYDILSIVAALAFVLRRPRRRGDR